MKGDDFQDRPADWLSGGIPLGRIRGIAISVHVFLVIVVALWLLWALSLPEPLYYLKFYGMLAVVMMGSVLLHELGHCYGAHLVGGRAERIVLWPLGGLAYTTGAERSPYDEFIVVLLGPAVSLGLAAMGGLLMAATSLIVPEAALESPLGGTFVLFTKMLCYVNLGLFVFNVAVPLFPMDSARLIRALCSMRWDAQKVTYNLCLVGFFVAGIMTCLFLMGRFLDVTFFGEFSGSVIFLLIALFGIQSCVLELARLEHSYVYTEPWRSNVPFQYLLRRLRAGLSAVHQPRPKREPPPEEPVELVLAEEPDDVEALETELANAVQGEDFVRAAEIRDKLKNLRTESHQS